MRTLAYFIVAIAGSLLVAAALSYPVYLGVHALNPAWPFHRIASRLWLVLVVAAAAWVAVRLRLNRRADWGYGTTRRRFVRDLGLGFAGGLLSMLPVAAMLVLLGIRPLAAVGTARLLHLVYSGLLSGLAVGFVEETLFRGLLQGAVVREMGTRRAAQLCGVVLVAALFAALHFLARVEIPAAEVNPWSGLRLLAAVGDQFAAFGDIADSFFALFAVGLLLGLARLRTGNIALAIGLHAGWVAVMRFVVGATARPEDAHYAWLASRSDGFTGWLVCAWTVAILIALAAGWRPYRGAARAWPGTPGRR
jgi:membrane protease YdiL (CAAX protease family)